MDATRTSMASPRLRRVLALLLLLQLALPVLGASVDRWLPPPPEVNRALAPYADRHRLWAGGSHGMWGGAAGEWGYILVPYSPQAEVRVVVAVPADGGPVIVAEEPHGFWACAVGYAALPVFALIGLVLLRTGALVTSTGGRLPPRRR